MHTFLNSLKVLRFIASKLFLYLVYFYIYLLAGIMTTNPDFYSNQKNFAVT